MNIKLIRTAYNKARELYLGALLDALVASEAKVTKAYNQHKADVTAANASVLAAKERLATIQTEGSKAAEDVNRTEGAVQDELQREISKVNGESNE